MIKKSVLFTWLVLGSRFTYAAGVNVNSGEKDISGNISGSLNIGISNDASVSFSADSNIQDYFSIATCNGLSSTCTKSDLSASANIDTVKVGASVTIIGDAAKGVLTIDKEGSLYTQQLWVSGNDNDKSGNQDDSSNGKLLINGKGKVFVVLSKENTPFKDDNINWNQDIISTGNNITDGTVSGGDLVLGKTGNGVIEVNDHSELDVMHDVIVSTGVTGAPNVKPSEIYINDGSKFNISGDMRGGVSASGKLSLTMDKTSSMDVKGNVSVGIGSNSEVTVGMSDKSVMRVGKDFSIATGASSTAMVTIDNSELSVAGSSSIGGGDGSRTSASLINGATISGSRDIKIAEGNNTHVEMTINNSSLTTEGALSIGSGNNSEVNMTGEGALVTSRGQLLAAKGEGATAKLNYTNSTLTTGSAVIASGNNASAEVKLEQTSFTGNADIDIGQGQNTTTGLTLSNHSSVNANGSMSVAKGEKTKANVDMSGGSALSAGSLSIGEGNASGSTLSGTDATLTTTKELVVAKGEGATAKLNYTNSTLTTGSAVIASGNNAGADVKLEKSSFISKGDMIFGQGTGTTTGLTLSDQSSVTTQGVMSVAKGEGTIANVDMSGDSELSAVSLSIGEGKASDSTLYGNGATLTTQQEFAVAKGDGAHATLDYANSTLTTGSAVIASGNNAGADVKLEKSSFTSKGDMIIGQGTGSSATMESNNTLISAQGRYVAAQGNNATASLKYNNTDITVGGAVLGAGEGAKATLDFNNSRLVSSGDVVIGDGQNAVAELSLSDGSVFKGERINIGNGTSSQNTITVTGGSVFDFGSSQNSAIGEGESSHSVVTVNNGYLYGDGSLTLAKGKNSSAELNLQDNAVSNANNISLAIESGSRAIVNISNANSGQFNPVSMGAGDGYAEVNFDGVNGYTLSTNFLCMDSRTCTDTVMNIKRGTVSLSGTNDWKGQINVYDGTQLDAKGNDVVDGMLNVSREARVDFNGYSQHMTGIDNKGMIYLSDGSASSDVYLDKDYVAHDGSGVQFGIFGQKEADVMHVNGDTSGRSGIVVTTNRKNKIKKGGDILLVEVNGDSSGSFYLNSLIKNGKEYKVTGDYIDVGAWEYALNKKRKNWYLSMDMRPEPGAFINNSKSMLDMFALQRYDIPGQHRYPTLFENLYNNGMWIQFNNNSGSNSEVYDNLKTSYSLNTMMIGGDIYNWTDGYNYSQIGVMGGIGSAANKTTSTNNKKANGNVDGYTLGLYHVFQQNISDGLNDSERQGLWTYSSIQYMDYSNSVSSTNNFKADYSVNGFRLTGEVGYLKNIGGIQPSNFYVEPKLYLSHTELSGGVVEDLQGGKITYPNTLTHIEPGVFFSYRKTHESTSNDEAMFKDYIKQSVVDAWFGGGYSFKTGNYSRTNFDSDMVEYKISDSFILKSGVEFEFLKDARLLLSSSYSINNDRNLSFILGGNYYF
ncbi:TPA: autotransporter outer membrane beta-barrel domain-containing protein [Escherichia coli]|nr:autotransporter outer membrane beta-barrel domain-containing protein [Escherichia coli]HBD5444748.1 autotransporter outer membrane beta-barrel domain-containing protein [Escherichia coli]HBE5370675.1 autotransporter outer membrane beta-barrel domain-containing protein [Escherichia coli]HBJ0441672.1 autotransporter outer membrane beta-barrel domain-containing protein [Escherichia coli]HCO5159810.1 autotransporter outer membrane beta-barrel domain-containing protein [Escherichia coli]